MRLMGDTLLVDPLPQYVFNDRGLCVNQSDHGIAVTVIGDIPLLQVDEQREYLEQLSQRTLSSSLDYATIRWLFDQASDNGADLNWTLVTFRRNLDVALNKAGASPPPSIHPEYHVPAFIATNLAAPPPKHTYRLQYALGRERTEEWRNALSFGTNTARFIFNTHSELKDYAGPMRYSIVKEETHAVQLREWIGRLKTEHEAEAKRLGRKWGDLREKTVKYWKEYKDETNAANCPTYPVRLAAMVAEEGALQKEHDRLIAQWKIRWLWFPNSDAKIDPFLIKPPTKPAVDAEGIVKLKTQWQYLVRQLECCQDARTNTDLQALITALADAEANYQKAQKELDKYNSLVADRNRRKDIARNGGTRLNDGLVYLSDRSSPHFMRQFDAARLFGPMNTSMRSEYYNREQVHYIVHNFRGDPGLLELSRQGTNIEAHVPGLTADLTGALGSLATVIGDNALGVASIGSVLALPDVTTTADWQVPLGFVSPCNITQVDGDAAQRISDNCTARIAALDTLLGVLAIKPLKPAPAKLFSVEVQAIGDIKPQQQITYTLNQYVSKGGEKKPVATGKYDLYRLKRMQLFAGVAHTTSEVDQVKINEVNGALEVQRENERTDFVVGLKVHPFGGGTDIDDDRIILHKRRLALAFAVGLPKPLDDLYAGFSYDLYPGINVFAMAHWYRNEEATIKNNKIVEERSVYPKSPPIAIGVSLDTSLFTSLLKVLAK